MIERKFFVGRMFGTDGIRGIANGELSCELTLNVGRGLGMILQKKAGRRPKVLLAQDTRLSGGMLDAALSAGLCSAGADVVRLGVLPTPAVAYLVTHLKADAGVMLSASHNPAPYNGIKIFGSQGFKLTDEEEAEIEAIVLDGALPYPTNRGRELGNISYDNSGAGAYIDHLHTVPTQSFEGMRVALDCANGSACATAKELFEGLGATCTIMSNSPDGVNINENCGSTHMGELMSLVAAGGYDLGLAFDGDADRCLAVDQNGNMLDGDQIIAILACHLREQGKLKGDAVVATVMSNLGFFNFAKEHGFNTSATGVGDRYVLEKMLEDGCSIGGEQSGHVILLDHMTTGDGQLTGIMLMDALRHSGKSLSELAQVMTKYPQVLKNIEADQSMKSGWESNKAVQACIKSHEDTLGEHGRILVRASGTEPLMRIMVEGMDQAQITAIASDIANSIIENLAEN